MEPEYNTSLIINKLKTNLEKYSIDFEKLCNSLKKYNGYLIGSFLLSAIMNKTWFDNVPNYNDLNICIIDDVNSEFENDLGIAFINNETNQFEIFKSLDITSVSTSGIYVKDESRNLNIRIFYVSKEKHNNIKSFINLFDFDICRNYFDGQNLFIENYSNIKNSIAIINLKEPYLQKKYQIDRIKRYSIRGFNIKVECDNKIYILQYYFGINCSINKINITSAKNLILIMDDDNCYRYDYVNILNNLPDNLEILQVYLNNEQYYDYLNGINFPITLKNLTYIDLYHRYDENNVNPKLPYDCKFILKK